MSERLDGGPQSAIVVGAGIVGLSTAWFLQERGVQVCVVDRTGVAAGASWGNAGWISPGLAIPLNDPAVLRYGLRNLLRPTAPLHLPLTRDLRQWAFLTRFAANCRKSSWTRALLANAPLSEDAIEAYDVLTANGVDAPVTDAPITAVFRDAAQAGYLRDELRRVEETGQRVEVTELTGAALREHVPLASEQITIGLNLHGQRYLDPARFVQALADSVVDRGATIHRMDVTDVVNERGAVTVYSPGGQELSAAAVVVATGAWLPQLTRRWVKVPVQAGRGYSFTVPVDRPVPAPVYLPEVRVACTPCPAGLRVAGTMEFRDPDAPLIEQRVEAIIAAARPLLEGVRWDERSPSWVGPRPVTPDGRPLIGAVADDVYVAAGHGMWGLTHGPITGRLLAEQITTGKQPDVLHEFDPLR
ncbi:NAD(P)/FAD-dependent oxidoreductase [Mycolicibacterium thermoresistibile]